MLPEAARTLFSKLQKQSSGAFWSVLGTFWSVLSAFRRVLDRSGVVLDGFGVVLDGFGVVLDRSGVDLSGFEPKRSFRAAGSPERSRRDQNRASTEESVSTWG